MSAELFDTTPLIARAFTSPAQTRNAIGAMAEAFACAALGMERQAVDGREKVCPDALWNGRPVEIKSVAKWRAMAYSFRLEKERAAFGGDYLYIFVGHDCPITAATNLAIVEHFATAPPSLLVTSLDGVRAIIGDKPPRVFNKHIDPESRNGWEREGYRDGGWQFSLRKVKPHYVTTTKTAWNNAEVTVQINHAYPIP